MQTLSRILIALVLGSLIGFGAAHAQTATEILREAESANLVVAPMKIYDKTSASGGRYIATNTSNSGRALYQLSIPASGKYRLSARIKARESSMNSLYVSVDSGSKMTWHTPILSSYEWVVFGTDLSMSAGSHQLWLHGREQNTEIDSFKLILVGTPTSTPTPTPTPAPSPTPAPTPAPTATPAPTPTSSTSLDPQAAPGTNFNLSLWKLTLPIDSSGGFSGTAIEIKPISKTYEIDPYFYTAADGAMVFSAPTEGATTSGSHYPRSELREMTSSYSNAAWTIDQGGTLAATLAVNEVPTTSAGGKGRVIVGQIHGPNDELCRLYYDNGVMYFHDDKAGSSQTETQFLLRSSTGAQSNIPLNAKFGYVIRATSQTLTVSVTYGGVTYTAVDPISAFWPGKGLYFKAGIYVQVAKPGSGAGTTGTGLGRASFYQLSQPTHP